MTTFHCFHFTTFLLKLKVELIIMNEEQQDVYQKAKRYVERLLAQHPRTIWEIQTKLRQKKFSQEIAKQVILEFTQVGFLNDEKYAKLWLENQIKYRPCGKILCYKKLLARGLSSSLVKDILDKNYSQEKEEEAAGDLAKRKLKFHRDLESQKKAQKIVSFLKSRGFTDGVIIKTLEKFDQVIEL